MVSSFNIPLNKNKNIWIIFKAIHRAWGGKVESNNTKVGKVEFNNKKMEQVRLRLIHNQLTILGLNPNLSLEIQPLNIAEITT